MMDFLLNHILEILILVSATGCTVCFFVYPPQVRALEAKVATLTERNTIQRSEIDSFKQRYNLALKNVKEQRAGNQKLIEQLANSVTLSEVDNLDPKPNAAPRYKALNDRGTHYFFTAHEWEVAAERARKNPEDIQK